jgi:hypothetical protein
MRRQGAPFGAIHGAHAPGNRNKRPVNAPELSASEKRLDFNDAFRATYPAYIYASLSEV